MTTPGTTPDLDHRSRPSVTAIVATRDRVRLLERAVASIVAQRYDGPVEVLVVFDGSEPVELDVRPSEHRSIRVLTNERTPGLAGARNTGLARATGILVAFCDDDDEWLPDKLDEQVTALERVPDAALAATGALVVSDAGGRAVPRVSERTAVTFDDLLRSRMQELHPSSFLARRGPLFERVGLVDEHIPGSYGEDYEFLLRASRAGPVVNVPSPLVRVHWHRASFFQDRWEVIVRAVRYLLDRYPEFGRSPRGLARLRARVAFAYAAMGERANARRWARASLAASPLERRAYLALLVSAGVVPAAALVRFANRSGRGI